ncbi:MAG: phosphotransferase, partial [Mycobacterium sp.]
MSTPRRSVGFNFLEEPGLPSPQVTAAQAEQILAQHYGLTARATLLGSNQDCNFLVYDADDDIVGVLKIANPAFNATELDAQDAAADLIADAEPSLRIAVPMPNLAGDTCTTLSGLLDKTAYIRLLRFLPGGTLYESGYLPPAAVAGLGEVAGRVSRALAEFEHPGLDRALQWDLRYGADVVTQLLSHVTDPSQRATVEEAAAAAWSRIRPLADQLPRQATHLDLTDANVVVTRGAGGVAHPDGVIDFGDLSHSWAVSELAITVSSVLGHPGADPTSILPGVRAFHAIRPLSAEEAEVLWPMVVLRTAVLIVSGAQQATLDPGNAYVVDQTDGEIRMFE